MPSMPPSFDARTFYFSAIPHRLKQLYHEAFESAGRFADDRFQNLRIDRFTDVVERLFEGFLRRQFP